jgi:hypothetical protein
MLHFHSHFRSSVLMLFALLLSYSACRIDDLQSCHSFGIIVQRYSCTPGEPDAESLGASPHVTTIEHMVAYTDPHNELARSPQYPVLEVSIVGIIFPFVNSIICVCNSATVSITAYLADSVYCSQQL